MKAKLSEFLQRLSRREQTLGGIALALILVLGLSYGVMAPGLSAANSAADRSATAAKELTTARTLAAALGNVSSTPVVNVAALRQSAEANGLSVVDAGSDQSVTSIRVTGGGPAAILTWVARAAEFGTMRSATIEPDMSGGAAATILFAGLTQ